MFRIIAAMLVVLMAGSGPAMADADKDQVRAALAKIIPGSEPDSIESSELPGMYEVSYGVEVFYVTKDGKYLLSGNLLDLSSGKNLTEGKRAGGRLRVIDGMDEDKMIVFAPEKVKHTITVFTDIDCPYCRRMHQEMDQLNAAGIQVRYLLFPRAGRNSKSYDKAVAVWCAEDRQQALTEAKAGKPIDMQSCDNPIDEHMALVQQLGISGTPTTVMESGEVIPGYVPVARLENILAGGMSVQ